MAEEKDLQEEKEDVSSEAKREAVKEQESIQDSEVQSTAGDDISEEDTKEDTAEGSDTEGDAEESRDDPQTTGSRFFKKKEKKDKNDEKIAELTDKVKRQMAEFENFRKRSEKEKNQMYEIGAKSTLEKILPVVDNFERGLSAVAEDSDDSFAQGMQMVYKQLMTALTEAGVAPIEAVGKEFDPAFHNAVMHVEDESYGENEVVEELQKGYLYHDTVLRHSMVKVAN